jgi:diguanylate cyclase (GGDEF)-like protein
LPPNVAEKIRVEQVNSLSILTGVMSLLGLGTVFLVFYEFLGTVARFPLMLTSVFIACCYCTLIAMSLNWGWVRAGPTVHNADRTRQGFVKVSSILGIAWGVLLIELMRFAHDDKRSLLYAVIIGLMSAGVMIVPASAAFAFWIPITISGLVAIAFMSDARDMAGTVLLGGYTSLTLFCIIYLNWALIRRILSEFNHREGQETIGLLLRDFEQASCDWLWETDQYGRMTYVSKRFAQAARANPDSLLGSEFAAILGLQEFSLVAEPTRRVTDQPNLAHLMSCHLPFRDVEISFKVGIETEWWSLTGKPKFSSREEFEGYRGVGSDVTQARRANDRARFLAHYDELTGLANRRLFREVLEAHCQRTGRAATALLYLDLDRFKAVNDSYGHPTGDALLVAVAQRLKSQVGEVDFCARLGGDEFAIIVWDAEVTSATAMAERLVAALSDPYLIEGIKVDIGVSIGVAQAFVDTLSSAAILRNADAALYQAKANGRGTVRLFDKELSKRESFHHALQSELEDAIEHGGLRLDFQPIFDLADGQVSAVEALVRWDRPSYGTLVAGEFVPIAESCGLIESLGEWVLTQACHGARQLPDFIRVAVNVSSLQLRDRRFIDHLQHTLESSGLDSSRLELELTETAFFDMSTQTFDLLQEIRFLGIQINLDDFGAGQTSLGQLRRFPFGSLKIDRSFVQDLPANASARIIVRGLASMATELKIRTTAEGVETHEQLRLVRESGCDEAQGFLLARPMSLPDVLRLIRSGNAMETSMARTHGDAHPLWPAAGRHPVE